MCYLFILFYIFFLFILFAEMERSLFICLVILWFFATFVRIYSATFMFSFFFFWSTIIVFSFSFSLENYIECVLYIVRTAEHDREHNLDVLQIVVSIRMEMAWSFGIFTKLSLLIELQSK